MSVRVYISRQARSRLPVQFTKEKEGMGKLEVGMVWSDFIF